jgi:Leucine-rich repeat (LRR) protein
MKKFFKILIPIILVIAIILCVGWYLFIYDKEFTRDMLLQGARYFESQGNHSLSGWFYDQAYEQADDNDAVAIELAQQHKNAGNYTKAEYTLSKAIADGGGVDLYVALCKLYVEQDKLLDASKLLDAVLGENSAVEDSVKQTLASMRPAAPTTTLTPGFYSQYLAVPVSGDFGTLYVNNRAEFPSIHDTPYSEPIELVDGENTIYAVSVGDNGMVSSLSIFGYTVGGVIQEVEFADAAVEAALRNQLEVSETDVIYTNDLWDLTFFTVPEGAKDLSDLQHLIFLEELAMDSVPSDQLPIIASLTNLTYLQITDTSVSSTDLKAIGALHKLESLTLNNCGLATTAGLEQLKNLTYLDLSNNTIRNIDALMSMTELQELYMAHNALTDLTSLTSLKKLVKLDVSYNSIKSLLPLYNVTGLQELNISNNLILEITNIDKLSALKKLDISNNQLVDASTLATCTSLEELNISNNQLTNVTMLSSLMKLTSLNFSHNQVTEIPTFPKNCALVTIDGSHNLLDTLKPLEGLKNLNNVYMDYNAEISLIDALTECPNLILVNVYGTKVAEVSKLLDMSIVVNYDPTEGF